MVEGLLCSASLGHDMSDQASAGYVMLGQIRLRLVHDRLCYAKPCKTRQGLARMFWVLLEPQKTFFEKSEFELNIFSNLNILLYLPNRPRKKTYISKI
jgi:hypothetical protein